MTYVTLRLLVRTWARTTLRTLKERYETVRDNEKTTVENQEAAIAALGAIDISITRLGEAAPHLEIELLANLAAYHKFRETVEGLLKPMGRNDMGNFDYKVFEHNFHVAVYELKKSLHEEE